jgi:hypothetical protein
MAEMAFVRNAAFFIRRLQIPKMSFCITPQSGEMGRSPGCDLRSMCGGRERIERIIHDLSEEKFASLEAWGSPPDWKMGKC